MGQYFKGLAHRTGLLEKAAHARQTATAATHRDVLEISQEVTAPVHAAEYSSADNKVRAPTNALPIQAGAIGDGHTAESTASRSAAVPPHNETPVPDNSTINPKENRGFELTNLVSKQLKPVRTETAKPPVSDQTVENAFYSKSDMGGAADQRSDGSLIAVENPEPVFSARRGVLESLISSPFSQQLSEFTEPKDPEISVKEKANGAKYPLSISDSSVQLSGHDEQIISTNTLSGRSYITPSSMPEKTPVQLNRQNIEIRIGSVTMEVHQKQPAVVVSTSQTKHAATASARSNVPTSGFRPGRYYLRVL